jgi:hypothetical protein
MLIHHLALLQYLDALVLACYNRVEVLFGGNSGDDHVIDLIFTDVEVLLLYFPVDAFVAIEDVIARRPQERALHVQTLDGLGVSRVQLEEFFTALSHSTDGLPCREEH